MFVLGLPSNLRTRLEKAVNTNGIQIATVVAGIGKEGTLQLFPSPEDAVLALRAYYDEFGDKYEDAFALILPYAPLPDALRQELLILEDIGAEVVFAVAGNDGWPAPLPKRARPDTTFLNAIFKQVSREVFGEDDEHDPKQPSTYFQAIAEKNPGIIITRGSLDTCDQVAAHRYAFLRLAADAFADFVTKKGQVGRIDAFFRSLGLDHAQSGGVNATLTVLKDGSRVYQRTTNTHLKQGDHTTPQAAARIYFHEFFMDEECFVAILYAGPHPENDITRYHEFP